MRLIHVPKRYKCGTVLDLTFDEENKEICFYCLKKKDGENNDY